MTELLSLMNDLNFQITLAPVGYEVDFDSMTAAAFLLKVGKDTDGVASLNPAKLRAKAASELRSLAKAHPIIGRITCAPGFKPAVSGGN